MSYVFDKNLLFPLIVFHRVNILVFFFFSLKYRDNTDMPNYDTTDAIKSFIYSQ
jgi:hypothetical protein